MVTTQTANLYDVLAERDLIAQATHEDIRQRLARPTIGYCGFDPTADSLHVGSLVPIMALAHLQRCGHKPVVVVGGATALVGDPSGKTEVRKMLTRDEIDANARAIAKQIENVVRFDDSDTGATMVNNADWLGAKGWIEMLREIGPHFSVNRMLSMESVKGRLESELGHQLPRVQLHDHAGVRLRASAPRLWLHAANWRAGSVGQHRDGHGAWSATGGRRAHRPDAAAGDQGRRREVRQDRTGQHLARSAARTSPYEFYQFWRNTNDADVGKFLRFFTFLPIEQIRELESREGADLNQSKETLAHEITKLIHGQSEADAAMQSARKAFGSAQDVTGEAIPHDTLNRSELEQADGVGLLTLMTRRPGAVQQRGPATGAGWRRADQR